MSTSECVVGISKKWSQAGFSQKCNPSKTGQLQFPITPVNWRYRKVALRMTDTPDGFRNRTFIHLAQTARLVAPSHDNPKNVWTRSQARKPIYMGHLAVNEYPVLGTESRQSCRFLVGRNNDLFIDGGRQEDRRPEYPLPCAAANSKAAVLIFSRKKTNRFALLVHFFLRFKQTEFLTH